MKERSILFVLAGLIAGALLVHQSSAEVSAGDASSCSQWETSMVATTMSYTSPIPEAGKPMVLRAPAGWEPFAVGPNGVVYRRCGR